MGIRGDHYLATTVFNSISGLEVINQLWPGDHPSHPHQSLGEGREAAFCWIALTFP